MIKVINGKKLEIFDALSLKTLISEYNRVELDIGCGDGKFVYNLAKENPTTFYIGVDASVEFLKDISRKARLKSEKGGLKNILFIQSAAESLGSELAQTADKIYINFPWGSLLEGIVKADEKFITALSSISKNNAEVELILTYNTSFEDKYIVERNLPRISTEYFESEFKNKLLKYNIELLEVSKLSADDEIAKRTKWGKQILSERNREVYFLKLKFLK